MTTALIVPFGADDTETGRARTAIWNRCYRLWAASAPDLGDFGRHHMIVAGDPLFGTVELEGGPFTSNVVRRHPFSVARAINRAVRLSAPEVDRFVCIGADALPDWRVVDWAAAELETRPWTLLFGKGASFGPDETQAFADGRSMDELNEVLDICYHVESFASPCVGPIAFTREAFMAVRGFDERFEGWGYEDVDFWSRLRSAFPAGDTGATSPYPLIQFSHPVEHHDLTDANPNVRLWQAKCTARSLGSDGPDHPADYLFQGDEYGTVQP